MSINSAIRERAREEARELLAAVMADRPAPQPVVRRKAKQSASLANKPRPPKYDRGLVTKMFAAGKTIKEISEHTGANRGTVSRILTEEGVPLSQRRGPYAKLKECKRGHDMDVHGRPNAGTRGGRYCSECKRERARVDWKEAS